MLLDQFNKNTLKLFFLLNLFLLLFSCEKNEINQLNNEIKTLIEEGKISEAIKIVESAPYESIQDPQFSFLSAKAYCSESLLNSSLFDLIFSKEPSIENYSKIDFSSYEGFSTPYKAKELQSLKKCLSSFYRSRHDERGSPLKKFNKEQKENSIREILVRLTYLQSQIEELIEFIEIFPYFFKVKSTALSLSLLVRHVEAIRTSHYDLREQISFFQHSLFNSIRDLLNKKEFIVTARGKSYSLKWNKKIEESFYTLAKETFSKTKNLDTLSLDFPILEGIINDIKRGLVTISIYPKSPLEDKIKHLDKKARTDLINKSLSQFEKFLIDCPEEDNKKSELTKRLEIFKSSL